MKRAAQKPEGTSRKMPVAGGGGEAGCFELSTKIAASARETAASVQKRGGASEQPALNPSHRTVSMAGQKGLVGETSAKVEAMTRVETEGLATVPRLFDR